MAPSVLRDATREQLLLVHPPAATVDILTAELGGQGLTVTPTPLSVDLTVPEADFGAALVQADGLDDSVRAVARRLKQSRPQAPVLLWGALPPTALQDALSAGFDLVLPPATPPAGVVAQLRALRRLVTGAQMPPEHERVTVRGVTIDFQRHEVRTATRAVPFTLTEFRIVSHLARRPGHVVSHTDLFREIHGYDTSEQEAKDILKVHLSRLRTKLANAGADEGLIVTVRGFGYLLERRAVGSRSDDDEGSA